MSGTETDARAVERRLQRRNNALFVAYYAALPVAMLSLARVTGLLVAGGVVAGLHILVHVPAFEARERLVLLTDEPPDAVRDAFSTAHNPLTSLWIEGADGIHEETDTEVRFDRSWILGLSSKRYTVSVRPDAGGGQRFEIRRGDTPVVTCSLEIVARESGTGLRTTTRRSPIHAFLLVLLVLNGSEVRRHLATCGYEVTDVRTAIGLRSRAGGRPDG